MKECDTSVDMFPLYARLLAAVIKLEELNQEAEQLRLEEEPWEEGEKEAVEALLHKVQKLWLKREKERGGKRTIAEMPHNELKELIQELVLKRELMGLMLGGIYGQEEEEEKRSRAEVRAARANCSYVVSYKC